MLRNKLPEIIIPFLWVNQLDPQHTNNLDEMNRNYRVRGIKTSSSSDAWVAKQLRGTTPFGQASCFSIRDRVRKYGKAFTRDAAGTSMEVLKTPYRAPKANAICERFLGGVRRECLNQLLVLREQHLYRVIREYVAYFNRSHPHQGIEQKIPEGSRSIKEKQWKTKIIAFPDLIRSTGMDRVFSRYNYSRAGDIPDNIKVSSTASMIVNPCKSVD